MSDSPSAEKSPQPRTLARAQIVGGKVDLSFMIQFQSAILMQAPRLVG